MTVPKHESNNPNLSRIFLNDLNSRDAAEQRRDREAAAKQAETDRVAKEAAMAKALKDARENTELAKAQLER